MAAGLGDTRSMPSREAAASDRLSSIGDRRSGSGQGGAGAVGVLAERMHSMARSGRRRAEVRRSRAPLLLVAVALLAIAVTVGASALVGPLGPVSDEPASAPAASGSPGDTGDRTGSPSATGSASGSPTDADASPIDVDLSKLPVPRRLDECAQLDGDPVREALGAPVSLRQAYAGGDRVEVSPGVTDVVAEDGCVFRSPRADARVWVFSAPVGTAYARTLVRQARRTPGCTPHPDETGFGDPTLTDVCGGDGRTGTTASLRGLFGDAWLTCQLSVEDEPADEVLDRAQRWCVEAAVTLGSRP